MWVILAYSLLEGMMVYLFYWRVCLVVFSSLLNDPLCHKMLEIVNSMSINDGFRYFLIILFILSGQLAFSVFRMFIVVFTYVSSLLRLWWWLKYVLVLWYMNMFPKVDASVRIFCSVVVDLTILLFSSCKTPVNYPFVHCPHRCENQDAGCADYYIILRNVTFVLYQFLLL